MLALTTLLIKRRSTQAAGLGKSSGVLLRRETPASPMITQFAMRFKSSSQAAGKSRSSKKKAPMTQTEKDKFSQWLDASEKRKKTPKKMEKEAAKEANSDESRYSGKTTASERSKAQQAALSYYDDLDNRSDHELQDGKSFDPNTLKRKKIKQYSCWDDNKEVIPERIYQAIKRQPKVLPVYTHKKPIEFEEVEEMGELLEMLVDVQLLMEALKREGGTITDQLKEEVNQAKSKMNAQAVTLYEHPWSYKYAGLLYDANREVYRQSHWLAAALTFKFVFQCAIKDPFGAAFTGMLIAACFQTGQGGINPINVTARKIELVRLIRAGQKDPFTNIVMVTNMNGEQYQLESHAVKLLEPSLIKERPFLQHLIRTFYPVWVGPIAFRVEKSGKIMDQDLFRAVLQGKQIDLKKTVEVEQAKFTKAEKEAFEKARLDQEIRDILQERRRPAGNLNAPLETSSP